MAGKRSFFQPLIPNGKTISIQKEHFHVAAVSIEEDEKSPRKQLSREKLFYSSAQSLEALAHVDGVFA